MGDEGTVKATKGHHALIARKLVSVDFGEAPLLRSLMRRSLMCNGRDPCQGVSWYDNEWDTHECPHAYSRKAVGA